MYSDSIPPAVSAFVKACSASVGTRQSAVWDGVIGDMVRVRPLGIQEEIEVTSPTNILFLTRTEQPRPLITRNGQGPEVTLTHPGWMLHMIAADDHMHMVVPEGLPGGDRFTIAFTPRALERLEPASKAPRLQFKTALAIGSPLERQLVNGLAAELENPRMHGRLYAESLGLALTVSVVRNYSVESAGPVRIKGGLAPWQVRRIVDYFDRNLAEDVSLSQLAALVGMSQSHFSRAFRKSTGMPPHQYQLGARIERAKHLLLHSSLRLNDIAVACGFAEQSHLSRTFRMRVGVSPGAWRQDRIS